MQAGNYTTPLCKSKSRCHEEIKYIKDVKETLGYGTDLVIGEPRLRIRNGVVLCILTKTSIPIWRVTIILTLVLALLAARKKIHPEILTVANPPKRISGSEIGKWSCKLLAKSPCFFYGWCRPCGMPWVPKLPSVYL